MELTTNFNVYHATVMFPDGETDSVEYVEYLDRGDMQVFQDVSDDAWAVHVSYDGDEICLSYDYLEEEATFYSTDNIRKIEVDWVEELVAVCEIDEDTFTTTESTWFGLGTEEKYHLPDSYNMPDVKVYHRDEWEGKT